MATFDKVAYPLGTQAILAGRNLNMIDVPETIPWEQVANEPVTNVRTRVFAHQLRGALRNPSQNVRVFHLIAALSDNYVVALKESFDYELSDTDTLSESWSKVVGIHTASPRSTVKQLNYERSKSTFSVCEQIVKELGRLSPGWAGPDSVVPSEAILLDIQKVAVCFPTNMEMPEVEVDPEDGVVVLRWANADVSETFSLTFVGRGEVAGFHSSNVKPSPAWKYNVSEVNRLANRLNSDGVQSLMIG